MVMNFQRKFCMRSSKEAYIFLTLIFLTVIYEFDEVFQKKNVQFTA